MFDSLNEEEDFRLEAQYAQKSIEFTTFAHKKALKSIPEMTTKRGIRVTYPTVDANEIRVACVAPGIFSLRNVFAE